MFKSGKLLIGHEILSTTGIYYRLTAINDSSIPYYVQIPWPGLIVRFLLAIAISALICYLLSSYLTKPLLILSMAAKSIATGKFNTRVGHFKGHTKDEIADLSDQFDRMAEQLETLVSSKERLLQDISHELRSPLARMNIAIELARNKTKNLANTELNRMELECSRLNALIGEILDFARLEKSTTSLELSTVDMTHLLQEIIHDANYENNSQIPRVRAHHLDACSVELDERLIHRAIENVLRNALHYSPNDQKVSVSLTYSQDHKLVYIDIKDNGPGVPKDQLEKIFNPFYKVDSSREKKTGGYGLGLAIAARAVQLHQGEISAVNSEEGGLLVRISLIA
jgi:two-component system sensor histidine kinase CpxA